MTFQAAILPVSVAMPIQQQQQQQQQPNAHLLTQIQELTQQLEKDKAALAQLGNTEGGAAAAPIPMPMPAVPTSSTNQINTAENHSAFLENFQQLIQSAKGIILKDPRQQQSNAEAKAQGESSSPKFNQVLVYLFLLCHLASK